MVLGQRKIDALPVHLLPRTGEHQSFLIHAELLPCLEGQRLRPALRSLKQKAHPESFAVLLHRQEPRVAKDQILPLLQVDQPQRMSIAQPRDSLDEIAQRTSRMPVLA